MKLLSKLRAIVCLILATTAIAATPIAAGADRDPVVIGHIESLSGTASDYEIVRGSGESPSVRVRTPLYAGDFLRVLESGRTAVIHFTDGTEDTVGPVPSLYGPYAERGAEASFLRNLMFSLSGTITDLQSQPAQLVAVAARGDDNDVELGAMFSDSKLLMAGRRRPLFARWRGGKPPFSITVTRKSGDEILIDDVTTDARQFLSETRDWIAGQYRVEIRGKNSRANFLFRVAPLADSGRDFDTSGLAPDLATCLEAYQLAARKEGAVPFEAYQRLAALSLRGYLPATLLLDALESGDSRYWQPPMAPTADSISRLEPQFVVFDREADAAPV